MSQSTARDQLLIPINQQPANNTNPLMLELMEYYQQNIAGKLAWVDGPANPWRQTIIRLACVSHMVFCAILSLSSEDLAHKYAHDHARRHYLQKISFRFRNTALTLLVEQIRSMRDPQTLQNGDVDANGTRYAVASTLILYNVELLVAQGVEWRMHLQAARLILQWREQTLSNVASFDYVDTFLCYEHYYASVFAGLTTFGAAHEPTGDRIKNTSDITTFSHFVHIIHRVTQIERLGYDQGISIEFAQIHNILREVEVARCEMEQLGRRIHFQSYNAKQDFQHLVSIFYHATLIYSYQVSTKDSSIDSIVRMSRDLILDHLNSLSHKETFAHDLVWPLFILGTECRGLPEVQGIVSQEIEAVMKLSGVLDRPRVLSFLRHYWSLDLDRSVTWIDLMRECVPDNSMLIL